MFLNLLVDLAVFRYHLVLLVLHHDLRRLLNLLEFHLLENLGRDLLHHRHQLLLEFQKLNFVLRCFDLLHLLLNQEQCLQELLEILVCKSYLLHHHLPIVRHLHLLLLKRQQLLRPLELKMKKNLLKYKM
jgi:hypothetical protein